jgi:predicted adenine nucleotide alpha hydrolase (AANH) superfamily ATPase
MDPLLLHTCCGPCSTVVVPALRARGFAPVALFANPNIQPMDELARRREALRQYAASADLELVVQPEPGFEVWRDELGAAVDRSAEERCRLCLRLRMRAAADTAAQRDLGVFATTLTVSPYQRHDLIAAEGRRAARATGVEFLFVDLRDRYHESIEASRRLGLYRQRYCGCVPSMWEAWNDRRGRRRRAG